MSKRNMEIEDLYRLSLAGDARVSPDGKRIAYVVKQLDQEEDEYRSRIWLWEDGETRPLTAGPNDSTPRWSPDGRWLAFLSGREGKAQIFLLPAGGGEAWRLTDCPLGAGEPVPSPDGRFLAFAASVPLGEPPEEGKAPTVRIVERGTYKNDGRGIIADRRSQLFVVEVPRPLSGERPEAQQLTFGDCHATAPAWSPDGRHLAFSSDRSERWDRQATADLWIVPAEGGEPRRITAQRGLWTAPVFSPDGSEIAAVGYPKPEGERVAAYPQLWVFPRAGGEGRNLMAGCDLSPGNHMTGDWSAAGNEGPVWTEDGIYLLITERGAANIWRWHERLEPVTSGRQNVMDFSLGGGILAYTVSTTARPAEIWRQPVAGGEAECVAAPSQEALAEIDLVEPERIAFEGAGGTKIDGWLMPPAGREPGQRYPLIVYIHGGPTAAYGETFFHEFQVLAGAGFGVFFCNPHGSASYGCVFQESIVGDWGNLDYLDVMVGVDRVLAEPWVDGKRLGVAGGSYGGFMVNWITSHTDRFAAACTQRSICNMVSQGGTSDWAATRGERLLATPEGDPDKLWAMSPLKYVSQVRTPTLILHSERDDRCPIEQGEQWFMALKRQDVPVRFVRFPEESHGLSRNGKPSRRAERLRQVVAWFHRYL